MKSFRMRVVEYGSSVEDEEDASMQPRLDALCAEHEALLAERRKVRAALARLLAYCERYAAAGPGDWDDFLPQSPKPCQLAKAARAALARAAKKDGAS